MGGGLYQVPSDHPVLNLLMSFQGLRRQVRIAIGATDLQMYSLLVSESLSCCPEDVGLRVVAPYHVTGLELHTCCLSHIGVQPNLVKQLCQDIKLPFYTFCLR